MKKIIILIVIFVVLIFLFKTFYVKPSNPKRQISNDSIFAIHKNTKINICLSEFKNGVSCPNTAKVSLWPASRNFYLKNGINIYEENAFVLSNLSKEEFLTLVDQLALKKTPNLFEFWPDAFSYENIHDAFFKLDVTKVSNEDTYYGKNPDTQIEMAARYENDKAFIRTKAKGVKITDDNGKWIGTRVLDRR